MAAQAFPTDDELRAMAPDHERARGPHRIMRDHQSMPGEFALGQARAIVIERERVNFSPGD